MTLASKPNKSQATPPAKADAGLEKQEKIFAISRRRGIFYPASEIHKGPAGFYDYGAAGTRIKRRLEDHWRRFFLKSLGENFHEIDPCLIMPAQVFKASGHLTHFADPLAECPKCGLVQRADTILEQQLHESFEGLRPEELGALIEKHGVKCPACKTLLKPKGTLNLMFKVPVGHAGEADAYLRPETAQGAYVSFKREYLANREHLPLGLAVIGKAFRNEISPRQGLFRVREFTQAELQIFFNPDEINKHERFDEIADKVLQLVPAATRDKGLCKVSCKELSKSVPKLYVYYMARVQEFFETIGVPADKIRFFEMNDEERAFYNKMQYDVEVLVESLGGFRECGAVHYRTDYDLTGHSRVSGQDLGVNKDGKKFTPHVIELTFGIDRTLFALLDLGLREQEQRTYFALSKHVAPFDAGIYPLVNKDGIDDKARQVYEKLRKDHAVLYDDGGSIGRRYARADEIGVPLGITFDYDTLKDDTVTVRDRDSTKQEREKISRLAERLHKLTEF